MAENENLISVETQTERSLTDGKTDTRIFVKMYKSAITSGLIADMGADNWQTLCVIASYMDEKGDCFPTQSQIAKGLGITRTSANRRVKRLAEYRWQGRPVIELQKHLRSGKQFSAIKHSVNLSVIGPPNSSDGAITTFNVPHDRIVSEEERVEKRTISGYQSFLTQVKERDDYICRVCGEKDNLVVHHLNSYRDHPEQRTDVENGITLCASCHLDFHRKYGFGNNTTEQFAEWRASIEREQSR